MGNQVRIPGVVRIEIAVAKSGEPTRVLEGHPVLVRATMEAAKQWRFRPYRLNGEAVEVSMRVNVLLVLKPRSGYRCRLKFPPSPVGKLGAANARGRIIP